MQLIKINLIFSTIMFCAFSFSQSKKECIYLLFDQKDNQKCHVENGSGEVFIVKKYRRKLSTFYICEECFILDTNSKIDTCNIKHLDKIKFEALESIEKERGKNIFS